MRKVIGGALVQDKKLVVVRKEKNGKSSWILPGGKPEVGESNLEALARELKEELPFLYLESSFSYYKIFHGISPNKGDVIENIVYLYKNPSKLDLRVSGNPDEPIKEARLLIYEELSQLELSDTTKQIVQSLRRDSYL